MNEIKDVVKTLVGSELTIAMIMLLVTLLLKDIIINIVNGILFYINRDFNIGDKVIFKDKYGIIINIGFRYTIISTVEEINGKEVEIWWYIRNENLKKLNLGKAKE